MDLQPEAAGSNREQPGATGSNREQPGGALGRTWGALGASLGFPWGCSEVLLCVAWVLLGALGPPGLAEEVLGAQGSFGKTSGRGKVAAANKKKEK